MNEKVRAISYLAGLLILEKLLNGHPKRFIPTNGKHPILGDRLKVFVSLILPPLDQTIAPCFVILVRVESNDYLLNDGLFSSLCKLCNLDRVYHKVDTAAGSY